MTGEELAERVVVLVGRWEVLVAGAAARLDTLEGTGAIASSVFFTESFAVRFSIACQVSAKRYRRSIRGHVWRCTC